MNDPLDPALYTDVLRTRAMASRMLALLDAHMQRPREDGTLDADLWGKNDCLSALVKLSMLLVKYIPLEQKLRAPLEPGEEEYVPEEGDDEIIALATAQPE